MSRKLLLLMLLALLIGTLNLASRVERVEASGTIYIRADGSVEPEGTPISTLDNITYTLTGNINDSMVIERDNILIDGAGYTVQKTGGYNSKGIYLGGRSNVTIRNMTIKAFDDGIYLTNSSDNSIVRNNITNNWNGIQLRDSSSGNSISGNNMTNNLDFGIMIYSPSDNNSIIGNVFAGCGLHIQAPHWNIVEGNTVNGKPLVYLEDISNYSVEDAGQVILVNSNNILVENLDLSNASVGAELWNTNNTIIADNNIANCYYGIFLVASSNNSISANNATANGFGIYLSDSNHTSISGNNVTNNGLGINLNSASNYNSVSSNNITANGQSGLWLYESDYNSIIGNNIAENEENGVMLSWSSNNGIVGNYITNNGYYHIPMFRYSGIYLYDSSNNVICHNDFVNNKYQVNAENSVNDWDSGYPSGGNYWSNYTGVDSDHDGMGDTPYTIDLDNTDSHPLMGMFSDFNATSEYSVQTICNSSITDFHSKGTSINFNVTGEDGTAGFCRICIPTALMNVTYEVFINGTEVSYNLLPCSNETCSYIYFNYTHSTQEVIIIPEFPSFLILPLFMIVTLLAVIVYRRRKVRCEPKISETPRSFSA
jgi:parallel beta-helix repeat protein